MKLFLETLFFAIAYFSISRLSFLFIFAEDQLVLVWPACGFALAMLLLRTWKIWPGIFLGVCASTFVQEGQFLFGVLAGFGNSLGALVGYYFLKMRRPIQFDLGEIQDVVRLFVYGALLCSFCNAFVGSSALMVADVISWDHYFTSLWTWWFADAMGVLMLTPALLVWYHKPLFKLSMRRLLEALVFGVALGVACVVTYGGFFPSIQTTSLTYMIFPFNILAALRFGQRGVVTGMLIGIFIAILGTANGYGPFVQGSVYQRLIQLDSFIFVVCFISMLLAALLANYKRLTHELQVAKDHEASVHKTKSQFLANMSHEIRTPIHGVLGMSELLEDTKLDETQAKYVQIIHRSSRELLSVINDILDFSKIEVGKLVFEDIAFSIKDRYQDICDLLEIKAKEKGLTLTLNVAEDVPAYVKGDPVRVGQVLLNLISNAVKFTEKGGIEVSLACSRKAEVFSEERLVIETRVLDSGIGIPADRLEHLFDAFSQADSSTTRKFGGSGLGLAICKQLVELMGGSIQVESSEAGTIFVFQIHLKEASQEESSLLDEQLKEPVLPQAHVLVVEDNKVNQKIIHKFLEKNGLTYDTANNGAEAVRLFSEGKYRLVLMDCQMPEMDGFQATKEIRKLEVSGRVPIVALTASAMKEDRERCLLAGMDDYLSKPINRRDLLKALSHYLRA